MHEIGGNLRRTSQTLGWNWLGPTFDRNRNVNILFYALVACTLTRLAL